MSRRRLLPVLCILATCVASSFFVASGVNRLLAREVFDHAPGARSARGHASARDTPSRPPWQGSPDPHAILARNIFDATTGPLWPPPAPAPAPEPEITASEAEPVDPRCNTDMRIAAASYNGRRPQRSWVVLRGPKIGPGRPFRQGMLAGEHTIAEIQPTAVRMQTASGPCWLGMFSERSREKIASEQVRTAPARMKKAEAKRRKAEARAKAKKARARRASRGKPAFSRAELNRGVRKLTPTRYVLDDDLVDKALTRAAQIAGTTRVVPARSGARVVGVRLLRLHRRGLLSRIGLERGDILRTVNGYALGNGSDVLSAYARLGSAERVTVAVQRGRRYLNLEYTIQ
jgi:hypothetical protein